MRKGVAIPYIIGLLIAIIVLAIAVFLIYLYVIRKEPLKCQECGAKFAAWCSKCYLKGFEGTNTMSNELKTCVEDCNFWTGPDNICDNAIDACEGVGVKEWV